MLGQRQILSASSCLHLATILPRSSFQHFSRQGLLSSISVTRASNTVWVFSKKVKQRRPRTATLSTALSIQIRVKRQESKANYERECRTSRCRSKWMRYCTVFMIHLVQLLSQIHIHILGRESLSSCYRIHQFPTNLRCDTRMHFRIDRVQQGLLLLVCKIALIPLRKNKQ